MAVPETGQGAARQLYAAATRAGGARFELDADVATKLAAACDRLLDDLHKARATGDLITEVTGFPNLPTGRELARGFSEKGRQFVNLVTTFQETALLYKAAYLAAGRQLADAEAANKAAIELIAERLESS